MIKGRVGKVFRAPLRDRHGDPIDADGNPVDMLDTDGNAFIGEVKRVILGGLSASPNMGREESSDTSGMIGVPRRQPVQLQFGDRVEIGNVRYRVTSNPEWDYKHDMTGTDFGYYWVNVEGVVS